MHARTVAHHIVWTIDAISRPLQFHDAVYVRMIYSTSAICLSRASMQIHRLKLKIYCHTSLLSPDLERQYQSMQSMLRVRTRLTCPNRGKRAIAIQPVRSGQAYASGSSSQKAVKASKRNHESWLLARAMLYFLNGL